MKVQKVEVTKLQIPNAFRCRDTAGRFPRLYTQSDPNCGLQPAEGPFLRSIQYDPVTSWVMVIATPVQYVQSSHMDVPNW